MKAKVKKSCSWTWRVLKAFSDGRCSMHAAGLTYYALLALVPVLCVLLTGAKALGADHLARRKIHEVFESQISRFEISSGLKADPGEEGEDAASAEEGAEEGSEGNVANKPMLPIANTIGQLEIGTGNTGDWQHSQTSQASPPAGSEEAGKSVDEVDEEAARKLAAAQEFIQQTRSVINGLLEKVEQFNVETLGWIGFAALVWTVISSIGMIELSFNEIWEVPKPRPIWKRAFLDLFVALVMPVLATLALSAPILKLAKDIIVSTAGSLWLTKWVSDGAVWLLDSWLLRMAITVFFATLVFAFLFKVMPNCRVKWRPAFWTGLLTALLFGGWLKLCAVAQVGIAKTSALYGSFAFLPIVLTWLYMSWQIVLLGCCIVRVSSTPAQVPPDAPPEPGE